LVIPKQLTVVIETCPPGTLISAEGWAIVAVLVMVHPLVSVTVTVYKPGFNPVTVGTVVVRAKGGLVLPAHL
jgi:hypothetical protein